MILEMARYIPIRGAFCEIRDTEKNMKAIARETGYCLIGFVNGISYREKKIGDLFRCIR